MKIEQTIKDWISYKAKLEYTNIIGIPIYITGEDSDLLTPYIGIEQTNVSTYEQGDIIMHGVTNFEICVDLYTVAAEGGTSVNNYNACVTSLYNILADRELIKWGNKRNESNLFDINLSYPITTAEDARRVTRFEISIIASQF